MVVEVVVVVEVAMLVFRVLESVPRFLVSAGVLHFLVVLGPCDSNTSMISSKDGREAGSGFVHLNINSTNAEFSLFS